MLPPLKRPSLSLVSKSAGNQNATLIHYRAPAVEHLWGAPQSPQNTEARRFIPTPRTRMPRLQDHSLEPRFCRIHIGEHLDVVFVSDLLARIHVTENGG
jgi:hypothetical protein